MGVGGIEHDVLAGNMGVLSHFFFHGIQNRHGDAGNIAGNEEHIILTLTAIHPQLASSRGIPVKLSQAIFTTAIAVVVTLSISSVGLLILNSLLVLPAASARNVARNLRQYHLFSVAFALVAGIGGLVISYYLGNSAGAAISLMLAAVFAISFCFRKARA